MELVVVVCRDGVEVMLDTCRTVPLEREMIGVEGLLMEEVVETEVVRRGLAVVVVTEGTEVMLEFRVTTVEVVSRGEESFRLKSA